MSRGLRMFNLIFNKLIKLGHLRVIDAGGKIYDFGQAGAKPFAAIKFHEKTAPLKLALNSGLYFGEAYMDGKITVEEGTLRDVLEIVSMNEYHATDSTLETILKLFRPLARFIQQYNPVGKAKENVAHHYDLSDQLYRLFLDKDMQYSCAYFTDPDNSLEQAQLDKKRHIASKMLLKPGMQVLDIGCGWGGMAIYLAKNHGVEVIGVTLSEEQLKLANERVKAEGLEDKIQLRLQDYRHITETFDRIVSVGMFEHVGVNHYTEFFEKLKALLKPTGVALLHSIGRMDGPDVTAPWLRKYIFPGGYAPAMSEVLPVIEKLGLWTTDIEVLRLHYAETLKAWHKNFQAHRPEITRLYDERFCRMWELYLLGAEMDFRYLSTMNFQMQITKDIHAVPLTRDYMYEAEHQVQEQIRPKKVA